MFSAGGQPLEYVPARVDALTRDGPAMGAIVRTALLVMLVALGATGCGLVLKAPQACLGAPGSPIGASPFESPQGCDPTP